MLCEHSRQFRRKPVGHGRDCRHVGDLLAAGENGKKAERRQSERFLVDEAGMEQRGDPLAASPTAPGAVSAAARWRCSSSCSALREAGIDKVISPSRTG
jgi:hypothetical protein